MMKSEDLKLRLLWNGTWPDNMVYCGEKHEKYLITSFINQTQSDNNSYDFYLPFNSHEWPR